MPDAPITPLMAAVLSALNLLLLVLLVALLVRRRLGQDAAADPEAEQAEAAAHAALLAQGPALATLQASLGLLQREQRAGQERTERELRAAVQGAARDTRLELTGQLADFQRLTLAQLAEATRNQNEQIDTFRTQLASLQTQVVDALGESRLRQQQEALAARAGLDQVLRDSAAASADALHRFGTQQAQQLQALQTAVEQRLAAVQGGVEQRVTTLQAGVEQRLEAVQASVDQRLAGLQADNASRLEQMRATVDEKLHATLEQRLGESFKQVAERLEQVHRGLGEMQNLAQGVGDLKRVLTNVKSRGVFGEVQLAALLEQVLTPQQYALNIATVPGSNERVEFAIRLPGRGSDADAPVWLPIDAKFPREDYERLLDAHDRADRDAADAASRALEQRIRDEARSIATKYLQPPHTTDFALLFLPTEGLYAELLRRPGLSEALQREHRITLAGPTTLLALLNSLQMGFRTLALERRSSEVWQVLGAVKSEFGKFGDVLAKTKKKLQEATHTIDSAETRTRAMARQLRAVEALPETEAEALLGAATADPDEGGAAAIS